MIKTLYICGDSFAHPDPDYTITPWFDLVERHLGQTWKITNLSIVCASNFHIRLQVDQAIHDQADFVIMLATSCVRSQGRLSTAHDESKNILERFSNTAHRNDIRKFGCFSFNSLDDTCMFDQKQKGILADYRDHIFDIDLEILLNQFLIEGSLDALQRSGIKFIFDLGGFEHPNFSLPKKQYFQDFLDKKSEINLWDHVQRPVQHRPFFHITDQKIHDRIADYYIKIVDSVI